MNNLRAKYLLKLPAILGSCDIVSCVLFTKLSINCRLQYKHLLSVRLICLILSHTLTKTYFIKLEDEH